MNWLFPIGLVLFSLYIYCKPPSLPSYPDGDVSKSYRLTNLTLDTTIDNDIYERFADEWWVKEKGAFTGLHSITPIRVKYFEKMIRKWMEGRKNHPSGTNSSPSDNNIVMTDVGCGAGILTMQMAHKLSTMFRPGTLQIFGVDPAKSAIEQAKKQLAENNLLQNFVHFEVADGANLPMRSNSVDILIMSDVLEHVTDLRSVMKEVSRVLKPGGIFLFDTMHRSTISHILYIRLAQQNIAPSLAVCPPNTHDYKLFITHEEIEQLFKENQFQKFGAFEGIKLKLYNTHTLLRNLYRYIFQRKPLPEGGILSLLGKFSLVSIDSFNAHYAGAAIKQ